MKNACMIEKCGGLLLLPSHLTDAYLNHSSSAPRNRNGDEKEGRDDEIDDGIEGVIDQCPTQRLVVVAVGGFGGSVKDGGQIELRGGMGRQTIGG